MIYKDPIIAKVIEKFNAEGPSVLRNRYYYGDPLVVPASAMPACFIVRDTAAVDTTSNAEDESRVTLVANVVFDLRRDWHQSLERLSSNNTLYEVIEGRNDDYTLKSDSLAYILRKYQTLDSKLWVSLSEPVEVEYGIGVEKRGNGIYTVEATVRFVVVHHQLRPGL